MANASFLKTALGFVRAIAACGVITFAMALGSLALGGTLARPFEAIAGAMISLAILFAIERSRFGWATAAMRLVALLLLVAFVIALVTGVTWSYIVGGWPLASASVCVFVFVVWLLTRFYGEYFDWRDL
jgi:hypothetical protein